MYPVFVGVGLGVGVGVGVGTAVVLGDEVGVGVVGAVGVRTTTVPLFQTNLFPDLMQVYFFPLKT